MESEIATLLRQNIPQPDEPVAPAPPPVSTDEASSVEADTTISDELTRYKLSQHFGIVFKDDAQTTNQLNYIYQRITETIGRDEYGYVAQAIGTLERIIGVTNDEQRLFKVYKWLKLDAIRQQTETEMRAYVG